MKYGVVCKEGEGWGLHRIAQGWATAFDCAVTKRADPRADANLWIGYSHFGREASRKRGSQYDAVLFTHWAQKAHKGWDRAVRYAHLCICQSRRYLCKLPKEKTILLHPGFHPQFKMTRKLRFLVVMAVYHSKTGKRIVRKRLDWFKRLQHLGEWRLTAGGYTFGELPGLIDWADYVVILSDLEGGPLVLGEALARGKPVIAPDVGYCWEWPVIRYSGIDELEAVIQRLVLAADYGRAGDVPIGRELRRIIELKIIKSAIERQVNW